MAKLLTGPDGQRRRYETTDEVRIRLAKHRKRVQPFTREHIRQLCATRRFKGAWREGQGARAVWWIPRGALPEPKATARRARL